MIKLYFILFYFIIGTINILGQDKVAFINELSNLDEQKDYEEIINRIDVAFDRDPNDYNIIKILYSIASKYSIDLSSKNKNPAIEKSIKSICKNITISKNLNICGVGLKLNYERQEKDNLEYLLRKLNGPNYSDQYFINESLTMELISLDERINSEQYKKIIETISKHIPEEMILSKLTLSFNNNNADSTLAYLKTKDPGTFKLSATDILTLDNKKNPSLFNKILKSTLDFVNAEGLFLMAGVLFDRGDSLNMNAVISRIDKIEANTESDDEKRFDNMNNIPPFKGQLPKSSYNKLVTSIVRLSNQEILPKLKCYYMLDDRILFGKAIREFNSKNYEGELNLHEIFTMDNTVNKEMFKQYVNAVIGKKYEIYKGSSERLKDMEPEDSYGLMKIYYYSDQIESGKKISRILLEKVRSSKESEIIPRQSIFYALAALVNDQTAKSQILLDMAYGDGDASVKSKLNEELQWWYKQNLNKDFITNCLKVYFNLDLAEKIKEKTETKKDSKTDVNPETVNSDDQILFDDTELKIDYSMPADNNIVAVVIGNKRYKSSYIPQVDFAERDAEMFKEYLIKLWGVSTENIIYMEDATKTDFELIFGSPIEPNGKLSDFVKNENTRIIIYYSGHGVPDVNENKGYLVTHDCDPYRIKLTGYPLELMYSNLSKLKSTKISIFLDACFSGSTESGMLIKDASPIFLVAENPVITLNGGQIFTSSSGNQISSWYREKGHGLFSFFLFKGLKGEADKNSNKIISNTEIINYLNENVIFTAKKLYGRIQEPKYYGSTDEINVLNIK